MKIKKLSNLRFVKNLKLLIKTTTVIKKDTIYYLNILNIYQKKKLKQKKDMICNKLKNVPSSQ